MKIGVMGTGMVGSGIGRKLASLGHDVMMGSRHPQGNDARELASSAKIAVGTHAEAATHGEWIVNALPGEAAIDTLRGCEIAGKILIDIANYDIAVDQPILVPLGEAIQRAFPDTRVVKTLNSVSAHLMVDPDALKATHSVLIASNHPDAKRQVTQLLRAFGWQSIVDLGDLSACRAMEQLIPLWMALDKKFSGPQFNLAVVRG
jgi:hypothetical protein